MSKDWDRAGRYEGWEGGAYFQVNTPPPSFGVKNDFGWNFFQKKRKKYIVRSKEKRYNGLVAIIISNSVVIRENGWE